MRRLVSLAALAAVTSVAAGCGDASSPQPREVKLDFCASEAPSFFAIRNDGAAWTAMTADASGTFTFLATQKVAVAYVRQSGTSYTTTVLYATTDELLPLSGVSCVETAGTRTISGSTSGLVAGDFAAAAMAAGRAVVFPPNSTFQLTQMPAGPADLLAFRSKLTEPPPLKLIIRRDVDVASGGALAPLDFGSTEAVSPVTRTITIENLVAGESNRIDLFFRTRTTTPVFLHGVSGVTTAAQSISMVPDAVLRPDDWHSIDVLARASAANYRGERQFFHAPSDRTATLAEALPEPTVAVIAGTPRVRVTIARQTAYPSFLSLRFDQRPPATRRLVVLATAGYVGTSGAWDVEVPDVSSVTGFPQASSLQSGADATWVVEAYQGSLGVHLGVLSEGARLRYAGRTGTLPIP